MSLLKENNYLLVLAPRYPERGMALYQQLKQRNFTVALRSQQDSITELTEIYVVDTLGELDSYLNEGLPGICRRFAGAPGRPQYS